MHFEDLLEEASVEVVPSAPLVKSETHSQALARQDALKNIEEELLVASLTTMRDVDRFKEIPIIPVDDCAIPKHWIEECGLDKARERYRVAYAGNMSAKDAPVALKIDMAMAVGIVKARAMSEAGPRVMNATLIQINPDPRTDPTVQVRQYPRKEIIDV